MSVPSMTLAVALAVLCGCAKDDSEIKRRDLAAAAGGAVEIARTESAESVTLLDNGERTTIVTGTALDAPALYPADGFIPADAEVRSSVSQGENVIIVYTAPGPIAAAVALSRKMLQERGWTVDDALGPNGGAAFVSYRKDRSSLSEEFAVQADGRVEVTQVYVAGK